MQWRVHVCNLYNNCILNTLRKRIVLRLTIIIIIVHRSRHNNRIQL